MNDLSWINLQIGFVIAFGRPILVVLGSGLVYALVLAISGYFPRPARRIQIVKQGGVIDDD